MHRRLTLQAILAFSVSCILTTSCDSRRVYEDNKEFNQRFWVVSDEPAFGFLITDSLQSYNLYYNIRNSLQYDWDRVFVTYTLSDSTGQELASKLVYNQLFDQTGKPLGQSGLGDLYDHQFPLVKDYHFPYRGKFTIRLTQFSRQDTLRGVLAVGIRVERAAAP